MFRMGGLWAYCRCIVWLFVVLLGIWRCIGRGRSVDADIYIYIDLKFLGVSKGISTACLYSISD